VKHKISQGSNIKKGNFIMKTLLAILAAGTVLIGISACKEEKQEVIIAKVGKQTITKTNLEDRLMSLPEEYRVQYEASEIGKKQFIDILVREAVIAELAQDMGIEKEKEYIDAIEDFKKEQEKLFEDYKKDTLFKFYLSKIQEKFAADDSEVKQYYDDHKELYLTPVSFTARYIFVYDEVAALSAMDRLQKGEKFENVAKDISQDTSSASNGGLIGPIKIGEYVPEFEKAILSLKIGETSKIVQMPYGYAIIHKISEQKGAMVPLEEAKEDIASILEKEKFDKWLEQETEKLRVTTNYDDFTTDLPESWEGTNE
jgi:parvulin-like peptidyl-prolyl isomerase